MILPSLKHLKPYQRLLFLLDQCLLTFTQAKQIQAHFIISGTAHHPFAAAKLIAFFAVSDLGDLAHARLLFRHLSKPTTFVWNTLIRAYAEKKQPATAFSLYKQMLQTGLLPNNYTFSFLLRASLDLAALLDGKKFHAQIVRLGWESYDFVINGLIHMYANCDSITSARKLFDISFNKDVVSWTAMVNGYAKLGQVDKARILFDQMPERNVVSWGAMINCYVQAGKFEEALAHFHKMQLVGLKPDQAGLVGALSACAALGAFDQGRWIHAYVNRIKMVLDRVLGTALLDMYAKCGCIEMAYQIFDKMCDRDVFTWTSMISGLANHGYSERAIELFAKMQEEGAKPNDVTLLCVLNACSRMGLVEKGQIIFESMTEVHGIKPGLEHYGCLVDLLSRAGRLEEAQRVLREMPMEPDSYVLGALLDGCSVRGDIELSEKTIESLVGRRLDHGGSHVLLSNTYASAHRWEDVAKVRREMEEREIKKVPGCSLIEVGGVAVEFVAGISSHCLMEEMMVLLHGMDMQLKYFECDFAAN